MARRSPARGADLAQRLLADLTNNGFDVWLDTRRITGGAMWTKEIEQALDRCRVALALLTPGSYVSEICRAEQLRALRKGKCVIPLLGRRGTGIPLHLEARNYRDFTGAKPYRAQLSTLLEDIRNRRGGGPSVALTALEGIGGIGKTVLAQALCHDQVVQQAFPDGVIWVTAGKQPLYSLADRLREAGKALKDDLAGYATELGCINAYRTAMRDKAALVVVDDVWDSRDIEPFRAESPVPGCFSPPGTPPLPPPWARKSTSPAC